MSESIYGPLDKQSRDLARAKAKAKKHKAAANSPSARHSDAHHASEGKRVKSTSHKARTERADHAERSDQSSRRYGYGSHNHSSNPPRSTVTVASIESTLKGKKASSAGKVSKRSKSLAASSNEHLWSSGGNDAEYGNSSRHSKAKARKGVSESITSELGRKTKSPKFKSEAAAESSTVYGEIKSSKKLSSKTAKSAKSKVSKGTKGSKSKDAIASKGNKLKKASVPKKKALLAQESAATGLPSPQDIYKEPKSAKGVKGKKGSKLTKSTKIKAAKDTKAAKSTKARGSASVSGKGIASKKKPSAKTIKGLKSSKASKSHVSKSSTPEAPRSLAEDAEILQRFKSLMQQEQEHIPVNDGPIYNPFDAVDDPLGGMGGLSGMGGSKPRSAHKSEVKVVVRRKRTLVIPPEHQLLVLSLPQLLPQPLLQFQIRPQQQPLLQLQPAMPLSC